LFETLERLRAEGKSILYISHRLEEVKRICDRATVLRHGKVVGHCNPREETAASLARMMVGGEIKEVVRAPAEGIEKAAPLLEIHGLSRKPATPFSIPLRDISLTVRAGEVIGIAGVAGNGQGELFEAVSGEVLQQDAGAVRIRGTDAGQLPISGRRMLGAAFVPEERLGHAAVPTDSLSAKTLLSHHAAGELARSGVVRLGPARRLAQAIIDAFDVRTPASDPQARQLSGGNLQKFVVGREMDRKPKILIVNQPTWGVDAGASALIRQALIDLARSGSAVLVISQDLDEIFEISDRIAVLSDGRLSPTFPAETMTADQIGLLMGGVHHSHDGTGAPEAHHAA